MKKWIVILLAASIAILGVSCRAIKRQPKVVKVPETKEEQASVEGEAAKLYEEGNYYDAVSTLKALIEKEPKNPKYWGQLGSAYAQLNQLEYSIYAYKKTLALNPRDVKAMYNLSVVYSEKGSPKEAKQVLSRALKLDPKNPLLQASLGNVMIDEEKYDKAKVLYERIVEVKPDFDVGHFNLGVINYQERNLEEAKKNYREVLSIKPEDIEAKQNLAAINILEGSNEEAIVYLKEVIASNPEEDALLENAYYNMGIAYLRLGNFPESLKAFETAIKIEPWDMAAYVNAAILAEELGQKEKAIKYWQKYDRLLPVNKRKEEVRKHLEKLGVKMESVSAAKEGDKQAAPAPAAGEADKKGKK